MKKTALLFALFLLVPVVVFAQMDQKEFLNRAMTWIDGNIQCQEYVPGDPGEVSKETPTGKCSNVDSDNTAFCHLFTPKTTQLILAVQGSSGQRVGGWWETDEKFIMFTIYDGNLLADVFYENGGGRVSLQKSPGQPDKIWIYDGGGYCGTSGAHLFVGAARKMKGILEYDYSDACHQSDVGFASELIPLSNGDYKLLKLITLENDDPPPMSVSETVFHMDPKIGSYSVLEKEKDLPFVKGIFEWQDHEDLVPGGGWADVSYNNVLGAHPKYLEELIGYLKLDKKDPHWNRAHEMLKDIANEDLGENYKAWEKWKNQLDFSQSPE